MLGQYMMWMQTCHMQEMRVCFLMCTPLALSAPDLGLQVSAPNKPEQPRSAVMFSLASPVTHAWAYSPVPCVCACTMLTLHLSKSPPP